MSTKELIESFEKMDRSKMSESSCAFADLVCNCVEETDKWQRAATWYAAFEFMKEIQ